ncbi:MAG: non-ribosomal peptide synthetase [Candidatus Sulfotelmatobacter sp.]|jgi:amino acid adenylation domain-containing protein
MKNGFPDDYPTHLCMHKLFEQRAAAMPDSIALVSGTTRYTYSELNRKANQLAHYLIREGVDANSRVGVFMDRSCEMVIAVLGILKAGGAYVPFDSTYPKERLAGMLQDIRLKHLLSMNTLLAGLPEKNGSVITLDGDKEAIAQASSENPRLDVRAEDLAYIIFTSGSTGKSKAAAVHHQGWSNLLKWFAKQFEITSRDKVLLVSSFSFDLTQRALAMPLICGGELHLLASNHYSSELTVNTIDAQKITLMNCAPSPFYPLIENQSAESLRKLGSLRIVFLGGEPISGARLKEWAASEYCKTELVNVYGVAECSDVSTYYRLHDFDRYVSGSVPIGIPIDNTQVHVMDAEMNCLPDGEIGELCIAGDGVGKGYVNDEELTKRKFITLKLGPTPEVVYRTGDLGRLGKDGNFEYVGRVDHQVKVHGVRVELEEIETILRQHPRMQEAIVVVKEVALGDQRIFAYVIPKESIPDREWGSVEEDLRRHARVKLPKNLVPNIFIRIKEAPLNPNGKIDRNALQNESGHNGAKPQIRERSTAEIVIGAFVAEALRVPQVGLDDDFFEMGGHSLMAIQVVTQINETFGTRFDLSLFSKEETTVSRLAVWVTEEQLRLKQDAVAESTTAA